MNFGQNEKDALHFSRQWTMGSCYGPKSALERYPNEIVYEKCCLPSGNYILTCTNEKSKYGWGNAYIGIGGKRYCDDFIGFKARRMVSVQGKGLLLVESK